MKLKSFALPRYTFWAVIKQFVKVSAQGIENIPKEDPFILVSNHASYLDPLVLGFSCEHRHISFMAKAELFKIPLLNWFIRHYGAFPIKRGLVDQFAIQEFKNQIFVKRKPVLVFPEGTRTITGDLQPAKKGIGYLISMVKIPVIPAYISGTFECLPKGKWIIKPGKVIVIFGSEIDLKDLLMLEMNRNTYLKISNRIMDEIKKLKIFLNSKTSNF